MKYTLRLRLNMLVRRLVVSVYTLYVTKKGRLTRKVADLFFHYVRKELSYFISISFTAYTLSLFRMMQK